MEFRYVIPVSVKGGLKKDQLQNLDDKVKYFIQSLAKEIPEIKSVEGLRESGSKENPSCDNYFSFIATIENNKKK